MHEAFHVDDEVRAGARAGFSVNKLFSQERIGNDLNTRLLANRGEAVGTAFAMRD